MKHIKDQRSFLCWTSADLFWNNKMMNYPQLFDYDDYKLFVTEYIKGLDKGGRGQFTQLAQALGVNTTLISQIFKGNKDLTLEQGYLFCEHWDMDELEADFFMTLLQYSRAGHHKLKGFFRKKILELRATSKKVSTRFGREAQLSDQDKLKFYSNHFYSCVRLLSSIPQYQTAQAMAEYLKIDLNHVNTILDFLLSCGLCEKEENKITMGPQNTHLGLNSPLVSKNLANWRTLAMMKHNVLRDQDLAFSACVSIGAEDFDIVRSILLEALEEIKKVVSESNPTQLSFINMDWIKY